MLMYESTLGGDKSVTIEDFFSHKVCDCLNIILLFKRAKCVWQLGAINYVRYFEK
jgi:hypothetical protein